MNSKDLYKFITDNGVEWRYQENDCGKNDVIIFPNILIIDEFYKLFNPGIFDHGGIECTLMDGYFAIYMKQICKYYNIELTEIFEK